MRKGTLTERLERSRADIAAAERVRKIEVLPSEVLPSKVGAPQSVESQLLVQVAQALDAATAASSKPKRLPSATVDVPAPTQPDLPMALPLVLAGRGPGSGSLGAEPSRTYRSERRIEWRQLAAPALLACALAGVFLLMNTGFSEPPRPKLTRLPAADVASPLVAKSPTEPILQDQAIATTDDLKLLELCETLISKGEIRTAREELARAAAAGSTQARFALAETFDPNVLAAWGLREDVADAAVARVLYDQALAAGDKRAMPRLSALK